MINSRKKEAAPCSVYGADAASFKLVQNYQLTQFILQTRKMHGVEPYSWLKDVLHLIADHPVNRVQELLPHRYKK